MFLASHRLLLEALNVRIDAQKLIKVPELASCVEEVILFCQELSFEDRLDSIG